MHTKDALLDLHERAHRSLITLMDHCAQFSAEELHREMDGFGYPSIQLQLHHEIGAERYWLGVLEGRIDVDEDAPDYPTIDAMTGMREQVYAATDKYLKATSNDVLNTAKMMMTWGGREKLLMPVHVILRTQMHLFHHQGQITAMCRLLERPINGLDYPVD
jgi:uncharacterized damage-inducible protein DinB